MLEISKTVLARLDELPRLHGKLWVFGAFNAIETCYLGIYIANEAPCIPMGFVYASYDKQTRVESLAKRLNLQRGLDCSTARHVKTSVWSQAASTPQPVKTQPQKERSRSTPPQLRLAYSNSASG